VVASVEATVTGFLQAHYPDNPDVRALVQGASLLRSGLLDSMAAYELVGILERRYGIEILDSEIVPKNFDSIRQIEGLVARKLGDTSPR
jgi:acyl carrier protein